MNTLKQCREDGGIQTVSNLVPTSQAFTNLINAATRELMNSGNWWTTVTKAMVCAYGGCFAWPRWVGTLLATNICGGPANVPNHWFSFIPMERGDYRWGRDWTSGISLETDGTTPVFCNIPCGQSNQIQVYWRLAADSNKTITIFGIDSNGQIASETLAYTLPYARSVNSYQRIDQVVNPASGPVDVYQYQASTGLLLDMAHYQAGESNPQYIHSKLRAGIWMAGGIVPFSVSHGPVCMTILAKQQFIPVLAETDVVQIDNMMALETMILALKSRQGADAEGYAKNKILAIKLLNDQMRDKFPDESIPVEVNSFGTALPRNSGVGCMQ